MVFLSEQSALYVVVLVCLALVLMMAITLILMFRRSATAEKQVKEMAAAVQEKLAQADEAGRENSAQARKELSDLLGRKVHLFLHVKTEENWAESREIYEEMGLDWVR